MKKKKQKSLQLLTVEIELDLHRKAMGKLKAEGKTMRDLVTAAIEKFLKEAA